MVLASFKDGRPQAIAIRTRQGMPRPVRGRGTCMHHEQLVIKSTCVHHRPACSETSHSHALRHQHVTWLPASRAALSAGVSSKTQRSARVFSPAPCQMHKPAMASRTVCSCVGQDMSEGGLQRVAGATRYIPHAMWLMPPARRAALADRSQPYLGLLPQQTLVDLIHVVRAVAVGFVAVPQRPHPLLEPNQRCICHRRQSKRQASILKDLPLGQCELSCERAGPHCLDPLPTRHPRSDLRHLMVQVCVGSQTKTIKRRKRC